MSLLQILEYDVQKDKVGEFQKWAAENAAATAEAMPEGCTFVGHFFAIYRLDSNRAKCKTVMQFENYAALDRYSEAVAKEPLTSILLKGSQFVEGESLQGLWKSIGDTVFLNVE